MVDFSPLFEQEAKRYGLNPGLLSKVAQIESSGNPSVVNKFGFKGLFQEGAPYVAANGGGDPLNPVDATAMAAHGFAHSRDVLSHALGRRPTDGELYLAHQQGEGGATKLLSNPNALAASLVGNAAVVNNGGTPNETAADFAHHWTSRLDGENQGQGPTQANAQSQFGAVGLPATQGSPTPQAATVTAPSPQPASPMSDLAGSLAGLVGGMAVPQPATQAPLPHQSVPSAFPSAPDPMALAQSLLAGTHGNLVLGQ